MELDEEDYITEDSPEFPAFIKTGVHETLLRMSKKHRPDDAFVILMSSAMSLAAYRAVTPEMMDEIFKDALSRYTRDYPKFSEARGAAAASQGGNK